MAVYKSSYNTALTNDFSALDYVQTITGSCTVTGSLTVTGSVTVTGAVTVSGNVTIASGNVTLAATAQVTGALTISGDVTIASGNVTLAATAQVTGTVSISSGSLTLAATAQITGTVTTTTLVGGTQISADFTVSINSKTSGNTISATFTLPAAGIQKDIAAIVYNPATADVTVNAYAVESSMDGATRNALLATWIVPFGTTNITLLTGAFLATDLLFTAAPNSDLTTAAATALFTIRVRQKNG